MSLDRSSESRMQERHRLSLGERIGEGGMAEVFRARLHGEAGFVKEVAIKRVLGSLSQDPSFAQMFENEAKLASMLSHPNIVSVHNFSRDEEGRLFITMELVDGKDLCELANSGRLPPPLTAHVVLQILRGLHHAHEKKNGDKPLGLVHRDMSPHNVLISWEGAVKVTDFGIAKAFAIKGRSATHTVKGKLGYLSPEQATGQLLDRRSDLYSVGVMMHELLTGRPLFAFEDSTGPELLLRTLNQEIAAPSHPSGDVPRELADFCMKLLEKNPGQRPATAEEAIRALLATGRTSITSEIDLARLMRARFLDANSGAQAPEPTPSLPVVTPTREGTQFLLEGELEGRPTHDRTRVVETSAIEAVEILPKEGGPPVRDKTRGGALAALLGVVGLVVLLGAGAWWGLRTTPGPQPAPPVETPQWPVVTNHPDAGRLDASVATPIVKHDAGTRTLANIQKVEPPKRPKKRPPPTPPPPPPPPGVLQVKADPWAEVFVDGTSIGLTPIRDHALPPGRYSVELRHDGASKQLRVEVTPGQATEVEQTF